MNESQDEGLPTPQYPTGSRSSNGDRGNFPAAPLHSPPTDRKAWRIYWANLGQPWRTEPEISPQRQSELKLRLIIQPDIENGIYPFKSIDSKLDRADVEWLLANHEDKPALADWEIASHRNLRRGLDLRGADLQWLDLHSLPLPGLLGGLPRETWFTATKEQREAAAIHLEGANLSRARLDMAVLRSAHLEGVNLSHAHLEKATLRGAHLEGKILAPSEPDQSAQEQAGYSQTLEPADLRYAFFDRATTLDGIMLGNKEFGFAKLGNVRWGEANVTDVDWSEVILGDELEAHKWMGGGKARDKGIALTMMHAAVQANRQLANVLREQGENEAANRFAFRAELWQRRVFGQQGWQKFGPYLFSWLRFLLAGYGYRPSFSFMAYLFVIFGFSSAYYALGQGKSPHLSILEAVVLSMTAFHGRGFFPSDIPLADPRTLLAAVEALVGLLIEVSLISTFTQRFFGR